VGSEVQRLVRQRAETAIATPHRGFPTARAEVYEHTISVQLIPARHELRRIARVVATLEYVDESCTLRASWCIPYLSSDAWLTLELLHGYYSQTVQACQSVPCGPYRASLGTERQNINTQKPHQRTAHDLFATDWS
jgi:hypothetical protein